MDLKIIGIRKNPDYLALAVDYFTAKWQVDRQIYQDAMAHSLTTEQPLPRWFLLMDQDKVAGGYGLITNDFISRQDLWPWLCALYVEEAYRGHHLGARLLRHGRKTACKLGFNKIYLCTDLKNYYEKYGWQLIGRGFHPWGESSAIYEQQTDIATDTDANKIEKAQPDDLPAILALQKLAFQEEAERYQDFSLPPLTESLTDLKEQACRKVIMKYTINSVIVGAVRGFACDGVCHIGRLVVHPEYQNRGIGKQLMLAIENQFSDMPYELFTGHKSEKNLKLYEKLGYRPYKTEYVKDGLDMIYMRKSNSQP